MFATYIAQADILNQRWVEVAALNNLLQQLDDHTIEIGVLEATLCGLGEGGADGKGDNDIVWVLLGATIEVRNVDDGMQRGGLHGVEASLAGEAQLLGELS
jgi:hypothetical protein